MIRAGFLPPEDRADLIALARDGSAAHRLGRRANALVLLDAGVGDDRPAVETSLDPTPFHRSKFRLFANVADKSRISAFPPFCP
jgi:hypothetical protein